MRKGLAVSTFPTGFGPIVFAGDLCDKLDVISQLEYNGIDLFIKRPDEPGLEKVLQTVLDKGLKVATVAAVSALVDEGLSLCDQDSGVRDALIERMKGQIKLAGELGAMVPIGMIRGSAAVGEPKKAALERLASSIGRLQELASRENVNLVLEPVNRYETNLINSVNDAMEFLDMYKLQMSLLLDTFHMNIEDASIEESIMRVNQLIGHVHLADSNRLSPGMGHLDFKSIMGALRHVKYDGFLSCEVLPLPDPLTSAIRSADFFSRFL